MSEFTKHDLLYLLEKIKAACGGGHGGHFYSYVGTTEHDQCLVLHNDGLIRCTEFSNRLEDLKEGDQCSWRYEG